MSKSPKNNIITLPNPHLRERSKKVGLITPQIHEYINQMIEATLDWEASRKHELGIALAAIQIDLKLRIVIIREDFEDKNNKNFTILINPFITKYEGDIIEDYEGCLSIKDIYGKVPRYNKVRVKATDINGKETRLSADGFIARVLQHEVDHTNGKVFIDHIKDSPKAFYHLDDDGKLTPLNYEKEIANSTILW